jgi:ubiquinone biosynthesis protein
MSPARIARLIEVLRIARRYGLDEFAGRKPRHHKEPRGVRLRLAFEALGPVFIKFGQALSTRPDLLPPDVALELAKLQDQVPSFPGKQARALIEKALGRPIESMFAEFDETPIASASVAQVHGARLLPSDPETPGAEIVIKVLRPDIEREVQRDVALLHALAEFAERWLPRARPLKPRAVITEYDRIIFDELDLMREGANCSQLRRNWLGSELIYHPLVFWDYTRPNVLVLERIHGIPIRELQRMRDLGVNFEVLSERGVEIFFRQVFRDNFFHADMHPGNIFVDASDPQRPGYLAVDFGIVGRLSDSDQRYLAENFLAFFNRDYKRVAELHVDSGWIPAGTRVEEFEAAIRTVCEPIFERPLKDISFGFFLLRLFQIARRFNYQVQPQLVLLQKTLLSIEGLGRQLNPELDLWKTAKPIMEEWMRGRLGPGVALAQLREQLPMLADTLPALAARWIRALERGPLALGPPPVPVAELRQEIRRGQRKGAWMIAGATCWVVAGMLLSVAEVAGTRVALGGWLPIGVLAAAGTLSWLRALLGGTGT